MIEAFELVVCGEKTNLPRGRIVEASAPPNRPDLKESEMSREEPRFGGRRSGVWDKSSDCGTREDRAPDAASIPFAQKSQPQ